MTAKRSRPGVGTEAAEDKMVDAELVENDSQSTTEDDLDTSDETTDSSALDVGISAEQDEASHRAHLRAVDAKAAETIQHYADEGYLTSPYVNMLASSITDAWVAERFAEAPEAAVVAVTKMSKRLFVFDGQHWDEQDVAKGLGRVALDWTRRCGEVADDLRGRVMVMKFNKEEAVYPSSILRRYEMQGNLTKLVPVIHRSKRIEVADDAMNRARHLLVCSNGTWDQKAQEFRESRPEDRMVRMVDAPYEPGYRHPEFEQLLYVWGGRGHEIEQFMQLRMAESLLGRTTDRVVVFIEGEPDCGKSTFFEHWVGFFPEFGDGMPKTLLSGKEGDNSTQFAKAQLEGKTFVWLDETGQEYYFSIERMKEMTTGGRMVGRKSGQNWSPFDMVANMFVACNHLPPLRGEVNDAVVKRVLVAGAPVLFRATPDPADPRQMYRDGQLKDRIEADPANVTKAALAWAIEGLQRLFERYEDSFEHPQYRADLPASIVTATEKYLGGADAIGQFLSESFQVGEWDINDHDEMRYESTQEQVWRMYRHWLAGQAAGTSVFGLKRAQVLDAVARHPALRQVGAEYREKTDLRPRDAYNKSVGTGVGLLSPDGQAVVNTRRGGQKNLFLGIRPAVPGLTGDPTGWSESDPDAQVLDPAEFTQLMDIYDADDARGNKTIRFVGVPGVNVTSQGYKAAAYRAQHGGAVKGLPKQP